jgi:uncharacterized protein YraI
MAIKLMEKYLKALWGYSMLLYSVTVITFIIFLCIPSIVLAKFLYITPTAEVALRAGKGNEYRVVAVIQNGSQVELLEEDGAWAMVRTSNKKKGWMPKRYLSSSPPLKDVVASLKAQINQLKKQKEIDLSDFKPTLSGYKNNAFVQTDTVGPDKKEMVVFWRKDQPEYVLVTALGGVFLGGGFQIGAHGEQKCFGEAHVAIDGETQFTGNLDYEGSTYTFIGKVKLLKYTFDSTEDDPLVLKLIKDKGFVYVKGKGTVTTTKVYTIHLGPSK